MFFLGTSHYLQGEEGHLTEKKFGLSFWRVNFFETLYGGGPQLLSQTFSQLSGPPPL